MALAAQLRDESQLGEPVVINGVIGPRGDGYMPGERMSARDAEEYHAEQIGTFAETVAAVCALW